MILEALAAPVLQRFEVRDVAVLAFERAPPRQGAGAPPQQGDHGDSHAERKDERDGGEDEEGRQEHDREEGAEQPLEERHGGMTPLPSGSSIKD